MIVSILRANSGICPCWKVNTTVRGWYGEMSNGSWEFLRAECDIIENSKLPRHEQEQKYEMMHCPDPSSCKLYTEFQPFVTKTI